MLVVGLGAEVAKGLQRCRQENEGGGGGVEGAQRQKSRNRLLRVSYQSGQSIRTYITRFHMRKGTDCSPDHRKCSNT